MKGTVKTKFIEPYRKEGDKFKTNLDFLCSKCHSSGVYFIKSNRTNEVIYIGYSAANLYKTVYRHFQQWHDKNQQRFVYSKTGYTIRIILTTPARAALLEKYLIQKFKPRDNEIKYDNYLSDRQTEKATEIMDNTPTVSVSDLDEVPF
jgi:excinuclease UvrABC nuclease subunit